MIWSSYDFVYYIFWYFSFNREPKKKVHSRQQPASKQNPSSGPVFVGAGGPSIYLYLCFPLLYPLLPLSLSIC